MQRLDFDFTLGTICEVEHNTGRSPSLLKNFHNAVYVHDVATAQLDTRLIFQALGVADSAIVGVSVTIGNLLIQSSCIVELADAVRLQTR